MSRRRLPFLALLLCAGGLALCTSCGSQTANRIDYQMGERVTIGPLTYNVIETKWPSQLGDELRMRSPERRFFVVSISVTNGGGRPVDLPALSVEGSNGELYKESENGEGVLNWIGMLREIRPAQTMQGRILFDVPLGSYRLRLPDGGEPGTEKFAWVQIPLHLDPNESVEVPNPGKQ
jgi:hypothetical protein